MYLVIPLIKLILLPLGNHNIAWKNFGKPDGADDGLLYLYYIFKIDPGPICRGLAGSSDLRPTND